MRIHLTSFFFFGDLFIISENSDSVSKVLGVTLLILFVIWSNMLPLQMKNRYPFVSPFCPSPLIFSLPYTIVLNKALRTSLYS